MPLMYHKDAEEPVNVSKGSVATMKNRGWTLEDKRSKKQSAEKDQKDKTGKA